ncbi:MAG: OmpA family protein [Bacteroidota bacterium]
MKKSYLILTVFAVFAMSLMLSAQGDKYFKEKQYKLAIAVYETEVVNKPEKYMDLAKSYFGTKDFKNAIIAMEKYKAKYPKGDMVYADWFITMLKRSDSEVPMRPLEGVVNTAGAEAVPRISSDGKRLYFKSVDRAGGFGGEDIFYSDKLADGTWGAPVLFKELSSTSHETMYAMSSDGKVVILFGNYPGSFGGGDLFYSVKTADGWSFPCNIGGAINTKKWEAQASLSPDGKTLVFVTDNALKNHVGSHDLYVSNLTETGWSSPINMGSKINTKSSETRPAFAADGKTLYFSSEGHPGFGGTDIYMTRKLDDSWTNWSEPINLGRYINTLQNDEDLSVNTAGTIGYTVKENEVGAPGDNDIFQFVMPEIARPEQTITLYGFTTNEKDSAAAVNMRFFDVVGNKVQTVVPSFQGDGSYSVNLPFKKFLMEINMKGFLYYSEEIDLTDPSKYVPKKTIRDKIDADSQRKLDSIGVLLQKYSTQMQALNASTSSDIKATFEAYELLHEQYEAAIQKMEMIIVDKKYAWLAEEKKYVDVRRDFKLQRATAGASFKLDNIFFDLGKATLKDQSRPALDLLTEILVKNPIAIELGGHTDSIGSDENNMKLSQERVNSVRNYLVSKGIAESRVTAVGYGETRPEVSNSTEDGRAKNRRVDVKIIDNRPVGQEGTEKDLVEKKEEKKNEPVVVQKISQDFDMLSTLQTAAKIGGLPEGSECGEKRIAGTTGYTPTKNKRGGSSSSASSDFEKGDYIFKIFNPGIENFRYKEMPMVMGVNVRFAKLRNFEDKGTVNENNFTYFLKSDSVKSGIGYQFFRFRSLKSLTTLPVGIIYGFEGRMLFYEKLATPGEVGTFGHIGVPVGLRGLFKVSGIVIAPDAYYHIALVSPKESAFKANYMVLGASARWKFVYGGLNMNIGKSVNYLGFRAGLSF